MRVEDSLYPAPAACGHVRHEGQGSFRMGLRAPGGGWQPCRVESTHAEVEHSRDAHGDWTWTVDRVVKIVDPDTFDLVLSRPYERDLGFGMHVRGRDVAGPIRFRLLGIDAPEVRDEPEKAAAAREFVREWIDARSDLGGLEDFITATTHKPTERPLPDGAFGRWLVDLYDSETGERLADAMRAAGHYKGAPA